MKKLQFILACAALTALSSCSSDDQSFDPNEIRITTNVGGIEATTRAATNILSTTFTADNDQVNIYITENATSPTITYGDENGKLIATAKSGNVLELSSKQYYPSTGNGVDVWGVYPTSIEKGTTTFSVQTDQSNETNYKASDFLFAAGVTNHKKADGEIKLQFEHQLSKVIVKLKAGDGVDASALTGAEVNIVNTKPEASFTALSQTGPATISATGDVANIKIGTWSGSDIAAIIVPQTVSKGTPLFKVELTNGGNYTYVIPNGDSDNDVTFSAKNVVTYTLTLTTAGIDVKSEIKDWNTGTSADGDAILDD